MIKYNIIPPQSYLKYLFNYDPETGRLIWKIRKGQAIKGDIAGSICNNSGKKYISIRIDGVIFRAHRIIWAYIYGEIPDLEIDHINGNGRDNRVENLRLVDRMENNKNIRKRIDNSSGITGVSWVYSRNKWSAYITVNKATRPLGRFDYFNDAVIARKMAEYEYGFHANHGSDRPL